MADFNIHDSLRRWSLGNDYAYEVMARFNTIGHLVDDFVDDEVKGERSAVMLEIMHFCLIYLPNNPFYAQHAHSYQAVVLQVLLLYDESNILQEGRTTEELVLSYAFRGAEELIFYHTAYLLGGLEHANEVRRQYRQLWFKTDTFAEWKEELE